MTENCCTSDSQVMILPCSGGSNVGQLANQAAVELTQQGFGRIYCLAGIGGHLSGFVQSAKDVPAIITIDGCPAGCARATLVHAEIPCTEYIVVTELGIEKNKDFSLNRGHLENVKEAAKAAFYRCRASQALAGSLRGCCG